MADQRVYELCQSNANVTSELAKDPTVAVSAVCKKLYGHRGDGAVEETDGEPERPADSNLENAFRSGKWGKTKPSELFLQIYSDVLATLRKDPLANLCSPSLMGSNGVCPLTVIATIPDICRHMSNLIVGAQHEIFLATNYWMHSEGSQLISNALKELSRRRSPDRKVVVKIMYDRGHPSQIVQNHQKVPEKTYADEEGPIRLPRPKDIPHLDLEVVNYHKPPLGTFHAKFMVVDRRIALCQSNNIQDNDNVEMMTQFEGDIVDAFYDYSLITWYEKLNPPLPLLNSPSTGAALPTNGVSSFTSLFVQPPNPDPIQKDNPLKQGDDSLQRLAEHAAKVNLPQHKPDDPHYDDDLASECLRVVACLNPQGNENRAQPVSRLLNGPAPGNQTASVADIKPEDMMTPIIPIAPHDPFPIAMVNRIPYGPPTHNSLHVPQNAAWTSAMRNATTSVFIQSPDVNAQDLMPDVLATCRRGVKVTYYYCLGYNDSGELLPHQGGHNEGVAHQLYTELEPKYHDNLDIFAYVAKDQIHPIHNKFKKRSCHIKLLIADGHIGIQGSGNQDTQSWYHSQEVNVLIDSEIVCRKWMEGIHRNQNTHIYGKVLKTGEMSGCWVDPQTGKMADGAIGVDAGKFAWAKGFLGAINRVRGVGGF